MSRELKITTENHVKDKIVAPWFYAHNAWHYAPIQNGLGEHGIHDRIGCVPCTVTQAMVGKRIGLFVSVEAKAPGRRGEERRGMTVHQNNNRLATIAAGGLSICCDSWEDIAELEAALVTLTGANPLGLNLNG